MLAHDDEGTGPPVVLLHSSVCDRRMWDAQWPALTSRYRAVRADLRGSGESPLGSGGYSDADDVRELVEHIGGPVTLVGSSYGGRIALEVASAAGSLVDGLVLLCPGAGLPPGPELVEFGTAEDEFLEAGDIDAAVELNVRTWLGPEAGDDAKAYVRDAQRRTFDTWLAADPEPETRHQPITPASITAPTVVFSGAHDLADFRITAEHLATTMPAVVHVELPWAGHLPNLERPDEVTGLLLSRLPPRRPG